LALLKLGYLDSKTEEIINNLLNRSYYKLYKNLDENTINFVMLKVLNILYSIDNYKLLKSFNDTIQNLALNDPNLEIRNYAKKVFKVIQ